MVRPGPTLVDAALAGPLAPGVGPSPEVDAAVATADADVELARRWTGKRAVVPPDADRLIARLTALAAGRPGTVTDAGTTSSAETERS
jgi:hypothetical protein